MKLNLELRSEEMLATLGSYPQCKIEVTHQEEQGKQKLYIAHIRYNGQELTTQAHSYTRLLSKVLNNLDNM